MVLRLGSTGPTVVELQKFLNITADGNFGPKTEAAVKEWQMKNNLSSDGIVGPITWKAMGIATTDVSEVQDNGLNFTKNYLPKGQYFEGPTQKRWLFLHHTAGWHDPNGAVSSWGYDDRGEVATEFVLGGQSIFGNDNKHDGKLVQVFPRGGYGWHLGTGNDAMHRESVGIEVCNFGQLTKGGFYQYSSAAKKYVWVPLERDSFYTYVGGKVDPSQIVELKKPFRGFKHWHRYSDKQVEVLKEFILYIGNRDDIDVSKGIAEQVKLKGEAAFDMYNVALCNKTPGVWLHTNVRLDKTDLFPQEEIIQMLLSL